MSSPRPAFVLFEPQGCAAACETLVRATPLGRSGHPEEVAEALLYLAESAEVLPAGLVLRVAGGLLETPR